MATITTQHDVNANVLGWLEEMMNGIKGGRYVIYSFKIDAYPQRDMTYPDSINADNRMFLQLGIKEVANK